MPTILKDEAQNGKESERGALLEKIQLLNQHKNGGNHSRVNSVMNTLNQDKDGDKTAAEETIEVVSMDEEK